MRTSNDNSGCCNRASLRTPVIDDEIGESVFPVKGELHEIMGNYHRVRKKSDEDCGARNRQVVVHFVGRQIIVSAVGVTTSQPQLMTTDTKLNGLWKRI